MEDGRTILVDRGWAPLRTVRPPLGGPDGLLELTALLRAGGFAGPEFLKPVERSGRSRGSIGPDLPAMTEGLERPMSAVYAALIAPDGAQSFPVVAPPRIDLPNNHLEYAITWYALAAVLLVIYMLFRRRRR